MQYCCFVAHFVRVELIHRPPHLVVVDELDSDPDDTAAPIALDDTVDIGQTLRLPVGFTSTSEREIA
jgi:hypothetical protein